MRCPKCQYLSYDSGDRCRNCGYEFSLAVDDQPVEVTIARDEPGPGRLGDAALALDRPLAAGRLTADDERGAGATAVRRSAVADDLPLFTDRVADDQAPLVTPPAVPRPPLSVRRANPALRPRLPSPGALSLDLTPPADEPHGPGASEERDASPQRTASLLRRAIAGFLDLTVLGGIHAAVVALTLRLCELTLEQWRLVPLIPLVAFLLLLSGGYFVLFTAAGGQTIGKMVVRIRVVWASPEGGLRPVPFGAAALRTVACLGSVVSLGAGFFPALVSADRRAFHDRVAGTRVVTA